MNKLRFDSLSFSKQQIFILFDNYGRKKLIKITMWFSKEAFLCTWK